MEKNTLRLHFIGKKVTDAFHILKADAVVNYIQNQKEHHKKKSFRDEYVEFLIKFDVNFDQKYVFEFYDDKTD